VEAFSPSPAGRAVSSSEDPAAEFHELLIAFPIREEDGRAWPSPAGDLSNEYGTSRGYRRHDRNSDYDHGRALVHGLGHLHHRHGRVCRGHVPCP